MKIEFHVIELMAVEMISWKKLYDHGIFFDIVKLKKNENILIFQPYVRLIAIGSAKYHGTRVEF
jgi:hypothetical protein